MLICDMLEETTNSIIMETDNITRIKMSSGAIRTCSFLIKEETDYAIIDCGLNEHTVCNQLLPALKCLSIPLDRIRRLFITHSHIDHVGGMNCLLDCLPWVEVYAHESIPQHTSPLIEGMIIHSLQAVNLSGHTTDCFGFLDLRTKSLISGDAIQLWGIEQFGVYAEAPILSRKIDEFTGEKAVLTISDCNTALFECQGNHAVMSINPSDCDFQNFFSWLT